ncbi:MAG TPA: L,D-transpeptidase [Acidobacteriaceae bacterium]|nr:L,D-transpeptidase [Acidobacteriaceae bacterium]
MRIPATGVVVGLAMWVGLGAAARAADVLAAATATVDQKRVGDKAEPPATRPQTANVTPIVHESAAPIAASTSFVPTRLILVSIPDHKLALLVNGQVKATYPVAVGKLSTPSPAGDFTIISHVTNPTYSHKGRVVGPGPGNPVGTRWMGLSERGYGIHGTNEPRSIGKSASHGCIRMGRKDLEQLFATVEIGDAVEIRGERDAQITAVFDSAPSTTSRASADASGAADTTIKIAAAHQSANEGE